MRWPRLRFGFVFVAFLGPSAVVAAAACSSSLVTGDGSMDATAEGNVDAASRMGPGDARPDAPDGAVAKGDAGGACNALDFVAPPAPWNGVVGEPPAPIGGAIEDGTYALAELRSYLADGGAAGTVDAAAFSLQKTIRIAGSRLDTVQEEFPSSLLTRTTDTLTTNGARITTAQQCPVVQTPLTTNYSFIPGSPSSLRLRPDVDPDASVIAIEAIYVKH